VIPAYVPKERRYWRLSGFRNAIFGVVGPARSLDDELIVVPERGAVPPPGARLVVRVRGGRRAITAGRYRSGTHAGKTWLRVPFEAVVGAYRGYRLVFFLTIDPDSPAFQATYRLITGSSAPLRVGDLKRVLASSLWEVGVGEELRRDEKGELRPTGRLQARRLLRRVSSATTSEDEPEEAEESLL
jgi:hypothetical protein